jgi:hypothetical protein
MGAVNDTKIHAASVAELWVGDDELLFQHSLLSPKNRLSANGCLECLEAAIVTAPLFSSIAFAVGSEIQKSDALCEAGSPFLT